MAKSNYLEVLRGIPQQLMVVASSRLQAGNLLAGPEGELAPRAQGVTDFVRRCSLIHQEMPDPLEAERNWFGRLVARFGVRAMSGDFFFVDGMLYVHSRDGWTASSEAGSSNAPRHPNDPAWIIDILYGLQPSVELLDEPLATNRAMTHLAGIADLNEANRTSPFGVRRPIAARSGERDQVRFHVWLDAENLPVRVSTEHRPTSRRGGSFWSAIEFLDYGIDVPREWGGEVNEILERRAELQPT